MRSPVIDLLHFAFGTPARFTGTAVLNDWMMRTTAATRRHRTSVHGTGHLTHDPKIDDPALIAALRSEAFYRQGPRTRDVHMRRHLERLQEAGSTPLTRTRITPARTVWPSGQTPTEIAISIMAEITVTAVAVADQGSRLRMQASSKASHGARYVTLGSVEFRTGDPWARRC